MATQSRPVATPAEIRRSHATRVRSAVRTQLQRSQRRRQELSHALCALRRDLREFRNQVRMRLREMSHVVATRRRVQALLAQGPPAPPPVVAASPVPPAVEAPPIASPEPR